MTRNNIIEIQHLFGEDFLLAGSTNLCMQGLLKRPPNDIDIITKDDTYQSIPYNK